MEPVRPISPGPRRKQRPSASPSPEESSPPKTTVSPDISPQKKDNHTATATISPNEIHNYEGYPPNVRKLLDLSLSLTNQNLGYKYGSADPANGGMDCSGFIYYVLSKSGIKDPPRDAREQYIWVRKAGNFQAVLGHSDDTFELDALKPGDLLFWTGTYAVARDPDITHTMIYLGREKGTNRRIMVGASDGRIYKGQSQFGVSVFDFKVGRRGRNRKTRLLQCSWATGAFRTCLTIKAPPATGPGALPPGPRSQHLSLHDLRRHLHRLGAPIAVLLPEVKVLAGPMARRWSMGAWSRATAFRESALLLRWQEGPAR